jgi:hypothetical protein
MEDEVEAAAHAARERPSVEAVEAALAAHAAREWSSALARDGGLPVECVLAAGAADAASERRADEGRAGARAGDAARDAPLVRGALCVGVSDEVGEEAVRQAAERGLAALGPLLLALGGDPEAGAFRRLGTLAFSVPYKAGLVDEALHAARCLSALVPRGVRLADILLDGLESGSVRREADLVGLLMGLPAVASAFRQQMLTRVPQRHALLAWARRQGRNETRVLLEGWLTAPSSGAAAQPCAVGDCLGAALAAGVGPSGAAAPLRARLAAPVHCCDACLDAHLCWDCLRVRDTAQSQARRSAATAQGPPPPPLPPPGPAEGAPADPRLRETFCSCAPAGLAEEDEGSLDEEEGEWDNDEGFMFDSDGIPFGVEGDSY